MPGLNHEFLLLRDSVDRCEQAYRHINDPYAVSLHDDIIN